MLAYELFTLENGLRVIVHEDHRTPQAVVNVIYRVGSKDEDPDRTGFAHLFEHFMFEGSKHIPNYDGPLQRVGGSNNAFTSADITNYYLTVPSSQVETGFWLESDRMLELAFSQEKLDTQKSVVIEEFKQRYLNQPYGDAHLRLRALHFTTHPYRWATIGKEISHIADATLDEVKDFFYGFYAPNNATLVVAGDVTRQTVEELAKKWFGPIPARTLHKHPLPKEPQQTQPRTETLYGPVPATRVYRMYHAPAHTERNYYVADLITDLLASGKSGILHNQLVRISGVAATATASAWGMHDPGCISIDGQVSEGQTIAAYEQALDTALESLQHLTEADLQRAKNKIASANAINNASLLNKTLGFAISDVLGDPNLVNTTLDLYNSISLDEVKTVARQMLRPANCSTLYYCPQGQ